jgi:signal transduction histidine kinase
MVKSPTIHRLLLVDDDPRNLALLKARLAHLGHELLFAKDGYEAVALFESAHPDLVLLDLMMPGIGGLEVLQRIRESEHDRHVPVILVTAHSEREQRLRGLQAGADEFLEKPIDAPILLARVKTLLALKESRDALQATLDSLGARNVALERARREQRELTQFVVHDLKSPLTGVCTNLQWVMSQVSKLEPSDLMASLRDANEAGFRLTSMIEDLLRVSSLEESADTVHPEMFTFSELLDPIVHAYTRRAELKGVSLLPPPALDCKIWADRAMLRRVLENILDNSLRYTPASGRVQISANSQDGLELLVANDGPCIALDDRSHIFEKFTRGSSEPAVAGSAGLGLYFCKRAVEANGGQITLMDHSEWPTCFRIQLPRVA